MSVETERLVTHCLKCQDSRVEFLTYVRTASTWPLQAGLCAGCTSRVGYFDRIGEPKPKPTEGNG